jgi:hypothetical protein
MLNILRQRFLSKLVLVVSLASFLSGPLQAAVVSSTDLVQQQQSQIDRDTLLQALERDDVQNALISQGVDPQQAKERVKHMTPAEVAALNQKIDEMPAGGILGAILLILVILIFTDMAGWTDVYPGI